MAIRAMMSSQEASNMTQTITIALTETEMTMLKKSAALDCRRPQEQARFLLRTTLLNSREIKNESDVTDLTRQHAALS